MLRAAHFRPDPRAEIVAHLPALRAFAVSLTRNSNSGDDLVQDTIIKAWTNIEKFQTDTNLRAWLFTILRNTFYSDLRKQRREVSDPDGEHAGRLCVKPDHDAKLVFRDFLVAFQQLSPEHREVLTLVGAFGFSYEETSDTIGVTVGTIKSRVNRARCRLCEILQMKAGESILAEVDRSASAAMSQSAQSMRI